MILGVAINWSNLVTASELMLLQAGNEQALNIQQDQTSLGEINNLQATQVGDQLQADITQQGAGSTIIFNQQNNDQYAAIAQEGSKNQLTITQNGAAHVLSIGQNGSENLATLWQTDLSEESHIDLSQKGDHNDAVIVQTDGIANNGSITQSGSYNRAEIYQTGSENFAEIMQNNTGAPVDNTIYLEQLSHSNCFSMTQHGIGHIVRLTQQ